MRRDGQKPAPSPMAATQPPPDEYLLMAAALMHRDGRLLKKDQPVGSPSLGPQTN
jgi:hypothetical protein